jgi:signal transduction histidine kinase
MLSRISLAVKAALISAVALTGGGLVQLALLPRVPLAVAIFLPLAVCCFAAWIITRWLTLYRTRAFSGALVDISRGNYQTYLPPAPDPEMKVIEEAFYTMARELDRSTRELKHQDAQRRRLFADLAHELGTPTASLLGIGEALQRETGSPEGRAKLLRHLDVEATRLERLIEDLRDLAHLDDPEQRLETTPVDVGAVAGAAVERIGTRRPDRRLECQATAALIEGDAVRLDQVCVNLIENALRHAPDGLVRVQVTPAPRHVELTVEDSGPGVSEEDLPKLGQRAMRLDRSRSAATGGRGLGLSIVAAIVTRHAGRLSFGRSDLGGLRVAIELPRSSDQAGAST